MLKRVITGACLVAFLVAALFARQISVYIFDGVIGLLFAASLYEISSSFEKSGLKPFKATLVVCFLSFVALFYLCGITGIIYALILTAIVATMEFTFGGFTLNDFAATVTITVYPTLFIMLFFAVNDGQGGLLGMILALAVSMLTDTFAYFVGFLFGKHKLCPTISPKKTVEGFFGGIAGGVIAAVLVWLLFERLGIFTGVVDVYSIGKENAILWYIGIGIVGALLDTVGDLVASQVKRKCGIKDYGNIFPGHGGVLDRIDGLTFVVALVYFVFAVLL